MFRFLAFLWDDEDPAASIAALRLSRALQRRAGWQPALLGSGLHVFIAGASRGVNDAHVLTPDRGVVLGKVFRRSAPGHPMPAVHTLASKEVEEILRDDGRALVRSYWGRYVAFLRGAPGETLVLRDPSGTLPCYCLRHGNVRVVFSWLEDVLAACPEVPHPGVDWEGVAAHVLLGELGGHDTALHGVTQVLPGEVLRLGREPDESTLLWNAMEIAAEATDLDPAQAAVALRETVRACARAWASSYDNVLLRLSGGVDSSILLSCLAAGGEPTHLTCLNYHSPGADSDERSYARLAAAKCGRELVERERDSSFHLESVLDVARTPTPGSYLGRMGTARMDAELAAERGAKALFTGGGGDQLFFEFRRWWPAADYLWMRGLDAGLARAVLDAAQLGRMSVWKTLHLAITDRIRPSDPLHDAGNHLTLLGNAAPSLAALRERFVHPALRSPPHLPVGKLTQTRQLIFPTGYYDPYEREAAPELVNPLLSQPLVELCLKLPTYVLTFGGRGRGLARQAFSADLPPQIATRRSKGGMEEHVKAVLLSNLDFARAVLLDGELVRHGILDRTRLEQALTGRPTALESHIGEFHVCIAIEAWLARWSGRTPRAGR